MLRDARTLDDGAALSTDVCVVGSGPAGLTVAAALVAAGRDVVVMETGGELPEPDVQALAEGEVVGDPLLNPSMIRHRRIGGNANAWVVKMADGRMGVRYVGLERHDFDRRDWIDGSGWPFGFDELVPYYERAAITCGTGPFSADISRWVAADATPWPLDPEVVTSRVFQFGPRANFTGELRSRIEQDPRATILHHATAAELELDEAGRTVVAVHGRHLDGRRFSVQARTVVIATGGLENARLLLMSNQRHPAGVGNGNGRVGRYLQDHPIVAGGSLVLNRPDLWDRSAFYDMRLDQGDSGLGHLSLAPAAQARHGLLGLSASFFPRPSPRRSAGLEAIKELVELRGGGQLSAAAVARLVPRLVKGADYLPLAAYRKLRWQQSLFHGFGRGGWAQMPNLARKYERFEIVHQAEQSPDPANRVTLAPTRDALGLPKLRVEWRFSRGDSEAAARARRLMAAELERAGIGTVTLPDDGDLPEYGHAAGTAHHIGTTRMHDDPAHGVVDRHAKLHEVANVYLAGSSVFPTGGYANPTLTAVALAHRLADRLIG